MVVGVGVGIVVVEAEGVDGNVNEAHSGDERVASSIPGEVGDRHRQRRNRRPSWKLSTNKHYIKVKRALSHLIFS